MIAQELSDLPVVDFQVAHVWEWFSALNRHRQTQMGQPPLSWSDIDAYFRRMKIEPKAWELHAIDRLDALYLYTMNKKPEAVKGVSGLTKAKGTP